MVWILIVFGFIFMRGLVFLLILTKKKVEGIFFFFVKILINGGSRVGI